jgi:short-subunit dehydrogenase
LLSGTEQKVTIHYADVSSERAVIFARLDICREHTDIHMLINNAAISDSQPFEQVDLKDYERLFDINFWGTVYCGKHFLPDLKDNSESRFVNVISDFALMGFPGKSTYGSSKSAVMALRIH